jgi:hypothetical protein
MRTYKDALAQDGQTFSITQEMTEVTKICRCKRTTTINVWDEDETEKRFVTLYPSGDKSLEKLTDMLTILGYKFSVESYDDKDYLGKPLSKGKMIVIETLNEDELIGYGIGSVAQKEKDETIARKIEYVHGQITPDEKKLVNQMKKECDEKTKKLIARLNKVNDFVQSIPTTGTHEVLINSYNESFGGDDEDFDSLQYSMTPYDNAMRFLGHAHFTVEF